MNLELLKLFWKVTQLLAPRLLKRDDELSLAAQAKQEPFSPLRTLLCMYVQRAVPSATPHQRLGNAVFVGLGAPLPGLSCLGDHSPFWIVLGSYSYLGRDVAYIHPITGRDFNLSVCLWLSGTALCCPQTWRLPFSYKWALS